MLTATRAIALPLAFCVACAAAPTGEATVTTPSPSPASSDLTLSPAQATPPRSEPAPIENDQSSLVTLGRYELTSVVSYTQEELLAIHAAFQRVLDQCLVEQGFDPLPSPAMVDLESAAADRLRVLRFDDRAAVERDGYHWMVQLPSVSPTSTPVEALGEVEGDAIDRCKTAANDRIAGGAAVGSASDVIVEAQAEILQRQRATTDLDGVREDWHQCMEAAGFPGLAINDNSWVLPMLAQPEASAEEIRTALADFECRASTGYTEARLRWIAAQVQRWLDENEGVVLAVREAIASEVERAEEVLMA